MQVHYHPHSATDVASDATRLAAALQRALRAAVQRGQRADRQFQRLIAAEATGCCPVPTTPLGSSVPDPGQRQRTHRDHAIHAQGDLQPRSRHACTAVGGHMHYVGVDEKVTLTHSDGSTHLPDADPALGLRLATTLRLRRADRSAAQNSTRATSSTSAAPTTTRWQIRRSRASLLEQGIAAPRPVTLGESTLDEMCLVSVDRALPAR